MGFSISFFLLITARGWDTEKRRKLQVSFVASGSIIAPHQHPEISLPSQTEITAPSYYSYCVINSIRLIPAREKNGIYELEWEAGREKEHQIREGEDARVRRVVCTSRK